MIGECALVLPANAYISAAMFNQSKGGDPVSQCLIAKPLVFTAGCIRLG